MKPNRFDVAAAYHHFTMLSLRSLTSTPIRYQAALTYQLAKIRQLQRIRYKAGLSDSQLHSLTPEAKYVYRQLVRKFFH
jgi:hypothetical protein